MLKSFVKPNVFECLEKMTSMKIIANEEADKHPDDKTKAMFLGMILSK